MPRQRIGAVRLQTMSQREIAAIRCRRVRGAGVRRTRYPNSDGSVESHASRIADADFGSWAQFAKSVGLTEATLLRVMNGEHDVIKPRTMKRLANKLGVRMSEIWEFRQFADDEDDW